MKKNKYESIYYIPVSELKYWSWTFLKSGIKDNRYSLKGMNIVYVRRTPGKVVSDFLFTN